MAILRDGETVNRTGEGQKVEIVLAATPFYVESGGQVSDTGEIVHYTNPEVTPQWEMEVTQVAKPVYGLIVHEGVLTAGTVKVGDAAWAIVDYERRWILCAIIQLPTFCIVSCAGCWVITWLKPARWWPRIACASTLATPRWSVNRNWMRLSKR